LSLDLNAHRRQSGTGGIRHDRTEEALGLFSFGDIARLQGERHTRSFYDDDDGGGLACAALRG
jgi:hypothetical protein